MNDIFNADQLNKLVLHFQECKLSGQALEDFKKKVTGAEVRGRRMHTEPGVTKNFINVYASTNEFNPVPDIEAQRRLWPLLASDKFSDKAVRGLGRFCRSQESLGAVDVDFESGGQHLVRVGPLPWSEKKIHLLPTYHFTIDFKKLYI